MKYLVTGGFGFVGSNAVAELLKRGEEVAVFDNLSRFGGIQNVQMLKNLGDFRHFHGDIRNFGDIEHTIREFQPDVVFHLAGQVAMTVSIRNPRLDFETNGLGTFNLLEAIRSHKSDAIIVYSSSNKVYGDLEQLKYIESDSRYIAQDFKKGFDESLPLNFQSPYGCSKGVGESYMRDYHKIFGLRTVVFRHSSMYGTQQYPTYDQGWVSWFCMLAKFWQQGQRIEFTISGNGKQVRDVLHSEDAIACYLRAVETIDLSAGEVFNIGGRIENSLSLIELFEFLNKNLEISLNYKELESRSSDQKIFVASCEKAKQILGWEPKISYEEGLEDLLNWLGQCILDGNIEAPHNSSTSTKQKKIYTPKETTLSL